MNEMATHIFELHVAHLSELADGVMNDLEEGRGKRHDGQPAEAPVSRTKELTSPGMKSCTKLISSEPVQEQVMRKGRSVLRRMSSEG